MPQASYAPPRSAVAYVASQPDMIRPVDLVDLARDANLTLVVGCDLTGTAAAVSASFCEYAATSAADATAATTAETARWLAHVRGRCADLLTALGDGEGTQANLDARRALRPPERGSAHYEAYAAQTWDATPRTNDGDTQSYGPADLHDEIGLAGRFRFLSETGLPSGLRAVMAAADAAVMAYGAGMTRGRPAAPNLHRVFLFADTARYYRALHGTPSTRGKPGGCVFWHRELIQTAAARSAPDDASTGQLKALASWARGERGGKPLPNPSGDELAKAVQAGMRAKITYADD